MIGNVTWKIAKWRMKCWLSKGFSNLVKLVESCDERVVYKFEWPKASIIPMITANIVFWVILELDDYLEEIGEIHREIVKIVENDLPKLSGTLLTDVGVIRI